MCSCISIHGTFYFCISSCFFSQLWSDRGSDILGATKRGNAAAVRQLLQVNPEDVHRQVPDGDDKGQLTERSLRIGFWKPLGVAVVDEQG